MTDHFWLMVANWWYGVRQFLRQPPVKEALFYLFLVVVRLCATIYGIWLTMYMMAFIAYIDHFTGLVVSAFDALVVVFWYVMYRYNAYVSSME